jgi:type III pantothenate kinase
VTDLVVDVGNSETVIGLVSGESPVVTKSWRISTSVPRTGDEFRLLLRGLVEESGVAASGLRRSVLCSVVPSVTGPLSQALTGLLDRETIVVRSGDGLPIRLEVDEPLTVGADRIVNTLGAKELFGRDTIAVDMGTATTFDCITADGVFKGGVIAQGLKAGIEWLGRRTAMLPTVELTPPDRVIGSRTETCMQSGVFYSAVEGIDGIVRRIREEWASEDILVIATGGYAEVMGRHCRTVDRIEPFLTLQGLALAGEYLDR